MTCLVSVTLKYGTSNRDGVVHVRAAALKKTNPNWSGSAEWLPVCYDHFTQNDARKAFFNRFQTSIVPIGNSGCLPLRKVVCDYATFNS